MINKGKTVRWNTEDGMKQGTILETMESSSVEEHDGEVEVKPGNQNEQMYLIEDADGNQITKYAYEVELF